MIAIICNNTSIYNYKYRLCFFDITSILRMAYGNEAGIVIVDIEQKVCLLNVGTPDLYGAQDPYSRVPRSPKRGQNPNESLPINMDKDERQPRSPSIDQVSSYYLINRVHEKIREKNIIHKILVYISRHCDKINLYML